MAVTVPTAVSQTQYYFTSPDDEDSSKECINIRIFIIVSKHWKKFCAQFQ